MDLEEGGWAAAVKDSDAEAGTGLEAAEVPKEGLERILPRNQ